MKQIAGRDAIKFEINLIFLIKPFPEADVGLLQHPRWSSL